MPTLNYIIGLALLAALTGCPSTTWEALKDSQDVDQLRRYVQDNPKDPEIGEARARIAELEYRAAEKAGTRYAYNAFLERHPESANSIDARRKLEELDFEAARQADSAAALDGFLRRYPIGRLSDQARRLRAERQCAAWLSEPDPDTLAARLGAHADLPCRTELEQRLKELKLERALASGRADRLMEFVDSYPNDPLTGRARTTLLTKLTGAYLDAARFDRARELIQARADADTAAALSARVQRAEQAWQRAGFEDGAGRRDGLAPLAAATRRLRAPLRQPPGAAAGAADPRERWLLADRLGQQVDEAAAEALLDLLGDSYLEVRRRALAGLRQEVASLGPIRGSIWLSQQRRRLAAKAQSGILLFKLAALLDIGGDPANALKLLQRQLEEAEQPDLLALLRASQLAALLGLQRESASLARRFSDQAIAFGRQRTEAWSGPTAAGRARNGGLILRQLHGLLVLWRDLLRPFLPGAVGPAELLDQGSLLGPWLERSRRGLADLQRWFRNEESRWARAHVGYRPCAAPDAPPAEEAVRRDVDLLALGGFLRALPTLRWAACCHPQPEIRLGATEDLLIGRLLRLAAPLALPLGP